MTTAVANPPSAKPTQATPPGAVVPPRSYKYAEEFLAEIGNVPVERIVFAPPPGTVTEQQVIEFNASKEYGLAELVNGTLILKTMGQFESAVATVLSRLLGNWQEGNLAGTVCGADGMVRMRPGNVRMPDVAFYPKSLFPDGRFPSEKIASYPAILVAEVLSESNTAAEIDMKLGEYFAAGTKVAWVIDPRSQTVRIYDNPEKPDTFRQIGRTDTLEGGDTLPNFSVAVADLFNV